MKDKEIKKGVKSVVTFVTLMQGGEGIETKAPSYIIEKLNDMNSNDKAYRILDHKNSKDLLDWIEDWNGDNEYFSEEEVEEIKKQAKVEK